MGGYGSQEEVVEIAAQVLTNALHAWYKSRAIAFKDEVLTRISDVTKKMLGDAGEQRLKTKGAETWGLLLFLADELKIHRARLGDEGDRLLAAAQGLIGMATVWDKGGVRLSVDEQKACWRHYTAFLDATQIYDELLLPKRHMVLHMLRRMPVFGNPRFHAAWKDESLNKLLKKCCRQVSQATFEVAVLIGVKGSLALQRGRKRERD